MEGKIAVIVGSIRRDSINRKLAKALVKLMPELNFQFERIDDLPVYNQDDDDKPTDAVKRLKADIASASALLIVTPEHNRSLPTALKNALDWVSRPYGKNLWAGKPAAIAGASIGAVGTAVAQAHLRGVLGYLDVPTMGQPEVYIHFPDGMIDDEGNVANEKTRDFLKTFTTRYAQWISTFR